MTTGHPAGQPDSTSGQLIPGVRYRHETRTRLIPHTVNGETRMVEEPYQAAVPIAPRDWDHIVLTAVTLVAGLLLAVSVVWSTASIGDLLARAVVSGIAYTGAVAFDLVWISCLALEWLARYDADKARGPRRAGMVALLVAMAAVCAHGWIEDSFVVGAASAAISALAKGMWSRVIRFHARPLDDRTRAWLAQRDSEISAGLALAARLRQQARAQGQHAALLAATTPPATDSPDTAEDTEDNAPDTSGRASATVRSAVRAAANTLPDPTPAAITAHLSAVGIDVDEDTVSALLNTGPGGAEVRTIRPAGQTVADSVRTALASGVTAPDRVLAYVRQTHGDHVREDTVDRTLRRVQKETA